MRSDVLTSTGRRSLSPLALVGLSLTVAGLLIALERGLSVLVGWEEVAYDRLGESTATLTQHVLVSEAILVVGLCALVSALRWWRPVLVERRRVSRWFLVVPGVLVPLALVSADWDRLSDMGLEYTAVLALTVALIGFNEELFARGILVVGVRRLAPEWQVWLWTSLAFGGLHSINLAVGAPLGKVIGQVVFLTFDSTVYYVARRASGTIAVPMTMHALWDFAVLSQAGSDAAATTGLVSLVGVLCLLGCLVTAPFWLRESPPRIPVGRSARPRRRPGRRSREPAQPACAASTPSH